MTMLNENTVKTEPVILIWDAASKSDVDDQTGRISWGVTVAVHKGSQTYAEMKAAADKEIARVFPTGAPFGFKVWDKDFNPQKYPELNPAEYVFVRFSSKDEKSTFNGTQAVSKEEFGRLAYPGCKVSVIGRCWTYTPAPETKNTSGLKWFFEGVQLNDLNAPRLSVSKGLGSNAVASAFGAEPSAAAAFTQPPAVAQPPAAAAPVPSLPPAPLAPNPGIVPPVPTDKLKALGHTVEAMQKQGWTIEQLREHGFVI